MQTRELVLEMARSYFKSKKHTQRAQKKLVLKGELNLESKKEKQKFREDALIQIYLLIKKLEDISPNLAP